jgi:epsin
MNKLTQNATGQNPFLNSQSTGMHQQTTYGQNAMAPAQTGPAGSFGAPYGANNPFGANQHQRSNQQPGSGNLIEF